jgi:hypothetical protein
MEEDYICCNDSKAAAIAALSFLSILTFSLSTFSSLSICSQIIASFICILWWDKIHKMRH